MNRFVPNVKKFDVVLHIKNEIAFWTTQYFVYAFDDMTLRWNVRNVNPKKREIERPKVGKHTSQYTGSTMIECNFEPLGCTGRVTNHKKNLQSRAEPN